MTMSQEPLDYAAMLAERSAVHKFWEVPWKDKQKFLEAKGYMLRLRYRSDWIPSWDGDYSTVQLAEDAIELPYQENRIDATRIQDGMLVYIKRISTESNTLQMVYRLSPQYCGDDPQNHCLPVLEVILDDEDPSYSYMVMPFLRPVDEPPFLFVNDVMDFTDQLLEGLVYMHERGVAHLNCTASNLMMDARALYPDSFHPLKTDYLPNLKATANPWPRIVAPVRYYYVGFDWAIFLHKSGSNKVVGMYGDDRTAPELSYHVPYDPFKVDVFTLGNVFRYSVQRDFSNIEFMSPLVAAMTHADPIYRPSAKESLQQWRRIRRTIPLLRRGYRLQQRRPGSARERILLGLVKLGMIFVRRLFLSTSFFLMQKWREYRVLPVFTL